MKLFTLILGLIYLATAEGFCGDSIVSVPTEACDDGNPDSLDGCSSTCQTEQDYTCEGAGPGSCSPGACTEDSGTFTCTCPSGYHGADTVTDKNDFSCEPNPTGFDNWIIEKDDRGANEEISYNSGSTTLDLGFQKSGGRAHTVTLYEHDCSTADPGGDLITVGDSVSHGKGTTVIDSKKIEYFKVPLTFDLTDLSTSAFLSTDKSKVEFCVKVELEDGNSDSINFMEVQIKMTIDLSADIADAITQIKRGDTVVYEDETVTNTYTLDACQCSSTATIEDSNRCLNPNNDPAITAVEANDRLTQSDILGICVSNQQDQGTTIEIVDILTLDLTQNGNTLNVISNAGGTVNVLSEYDDNDKKDHVHRAKTRITSNFFTIIGGASNPPDITISGTASIVFKNRRLRENGRSLQTAKQPVGKFSFNVNLAKDSEDASEDSVSAAIAQILGVPLATAAIFAL